MPRKITLEQFREAGVCSDGFMHFAAAFGNEIEVTPETCARMASKLNFAFGADKFLKGRQREYYLAQAEAENARVKPLIEAAIAEYEAEMAAWRANIQTAPVGTLTRIIRNRDAVILPLLKARQTQQAQWFAVAYNMEE